MVYLEHALHGFYLGHVMSGSCTFHNIFSIRLDCGDLDRVVILTYMGHFISGSCLHNGLSGSRL